MSKLLKSLYTDEEIAALRAEFCSSVNRDVVLREIAAMLNEQPYLEDTTELVVTERAG